jgi:predicted 2-oxoglutarate/Fe(II)-dependent dioxygenase YbiX
MNNMPLIFENKIIIKNASTIIDYINNHQADFGELGSDYWQGRTIYLHQIQDINIIEILKAHKEHMIEEFVKLCFIDRPIYIDSLHLVRWTEGYQLHPHADSEEPDGRPHPFPWRDFGTVTFLNEDFEGGTLYYPNKNNLKVPAATGYTAIHAGSVDCLHGVTPVTKGVRYTIASFLTYDPRHEYKIT